MKERVKLCPRCDHFMCGRRSKIFFSYQDTVPRWLPLLSAWGGTQRSHFLFLLLESCQVVLGLHYDSELEYFNLGHWGDDSCLVLIEIWGSPGYPSSVILLMRKRLYGNDLEVPLLSSYSEETETWKEFWDLKSPAWEWQGNAKGSKQRNSMTWFDILRDLPRG